MSSFIIKVLAMGCLFFTVMVHQVNAQFQTVLGTADPDHLWSLTPDATMSNWIISAHTETPNGGQLNENPYMLSVTANGVLNWDRAYDDPTARLNWTCDAAFMPNTGQLFATGRDRAGGHNNLLMELDPVNGNVIAQTQLNNVGASGEY